MIKRKDVAIIVHLYKKNITQTEKMSLEFIFKFLSKYDIFFMIPDNINPSSFKYKGVKFASFPAKNFKSIASYNKFALRKDFYLKFKKYKYMLICQLDALVLSDKLLYWCNKEYDYIAAPWFNSIISRLTKERYSNSGCGNGGFCLRNIDKALKIIDLVEKRSTRKSNKHWQHIYWFLIALVTGKSRKIWLEAPADNYPFNEDGFWSLEAAKYLKTFKVAPFKDALKFSFEKLPRRCYKLNNNRLPFGCHAWEKYDKNFWLRILLNSKNYIWSKYLKKCATVNH